MMSWGSAWQKIFLLGNCSMRCSTSYIPVVVGNCSCVTLPPASLQSCEGTTAVHFFDLYRYVEPLGSGSCFALSPASLQAYAA